MRTSPPAHRDHRANFGDFTAGIRTDQDCRDYFHRLRWPEEFRCPECDAKGGLLSDGRYEGEDCRRRTRGTAGTIVDRTRTRTPRTIWFHAGGLFATSKDGISAIVLKRPLELGSYQTARAMLTRLRTATVERPPGLVSGGSLGHPVHLTTFCNFCFTS